MKSRIDKRQVERNFASLCIKVLKGQAIDIYRQNKRRSDNEIVFSDMPPQKLASLSVMDEYFANEYIFGVLGESIGIANNDLAEALGVLPADKREIILMSYYFDMKDWEIAEKLNMARRTVTYRKASSLRELKKLMESE